MKMLKGFLVGLLVCFCLGAGFGKQTYDYLVLNNYIDITASALPAVSGAASGRIYVDSITNSPFISANTSSYVPLIAQPKYNYIMNGDGLVEQRGTQFNAGIQYTGMQNATDTYAWDRWKICHNLTSNNLNCYTAQSRGFDITTKALTTNVAQINTATIVGAFTGSHYTIACNPADAIFDGLQSINTNNNGTLFFTYADTHANVVSAASGGRVTEQGLQANGYMHARVAAGTGKLMLIQVIESLQAQNLRGKTVVVQYKAKADSTFGNLRSTIVKWGTNASTGDVSNTQWANPLVATWGITGADPIMTATGTNLYSYVTPANVLSGVGGSIVGSAYQQTPNADWVQCAYTVTIPTDYQQIALAFWSDNASLTTNNIVCLTEVGLYDAQEVQPYYPRHYTQELAMCQRYCYVLNGQYQSTFTIGATDTTGIAFANIYFPVQMRTQATLSLGGSAGTHISCETSALASAVACTSIDVGAVGTPTNYLMTLRNGGNTWAASNTPQLVFWNGSATYADQLIFNADY